MYAFIAQNYFKQTYLKKIISPSIKTHKGCQLRMPAERYIRYIYLLKCAIKLHLPVKW